LAAVKVMRKLMGVRTREWLKADHVEWL
jgi:hypothetical protein